MTPARRAANETNLTPGARRRHTGRGPAGVLGRALAGAAVVLLALLGVSVPAQAHDSLESTSPSDGSTVAAVPATVTLTLSNTPAAIGSEIKVLAADGTNWSEGQVEVTDNVATQALKPGAPAGKYTVQWRLVSADTHPIEGTFSFTATAGAAADGAGSAAAPPVGGTAVAGTELPLKATNVPQAASAQGADGIPWSVIGLIGVLVIVVVAMVVVARRRLGAQD